MIKIKHFTFNPFQENTYVLSSNGECLIVDPGCSDTAEFAEMEAYISAEGLKPVEVLNTHCHIDHIMGNARSCKHFGVDLRIPKGELEWLHNGVRTAQMYGVNYDPSPEPSGWLEEGVDVKVGNSTLEVMAVPGHSPAHIVLLDRNNEQLIGGDVLFLGSIGRTDLPGGDHDTLLRNIREKLFVLNEAVTVHPGHGPETTIGHEKRHNPFLT